MRTSPNKTIRITGMIGVLIATVGLTLNSCQKEEIKTTSPLGESYTVKSSIDCNTNCIEIGGPYFEKPDTKTITYGGGNFTKTVDIIYYNTESNFVLKVKSTKGWNDLMINAVDAWPYAPVAANVWGVLEMPLDVNWQACDLESFALSVTGQGPPANFSVSYNLIGICEEACATAFVGEAIACGASREATYTFTAAEAQDFIKIQGGLTNFTGADAVVEIIGGNLTVSQWTPGGSSNRVIKVEGSVDACEEVTINIKWSSTNSGGIITGGWSVKDEGGLELAPSVAGLECQ
jgi:hypothetical protein